MPESSLHRLVLALSMVLAIFSLGACTVAPDFETSSAQPDGTFAVDVSFREFYQLLGGEESLGYPISPTFEFNNIRYQYTEKALLQYDPMAPTSQQFSLAALGTELGIQDEPIVVPEQEGVRIVDGYLVYDEFIPLYDHFQGARFAGKPLTQVRINSEHNRIEQYFSNVGFFRSLNDETGDVHLLAYGAWKCDSACRKPRDTFANVSPVQVLPEPFMSSLSRLGTGFSGDPLSEPFQAQDGAIEQVYENFVVFANPSSVRNISLRPITAAVGYPPTGLTTKIDDPRLIFYSLQGDLGHNIPAVFDQYIAIHGGYEVSGPPATEIFIENDLWRQCFTNYCLDFDPQAAETLQVRPAPLGARYLEHNPPIQAAYATLDLSTTSASLSVWESLSLIDSTQAQQITTQVTENGSQTPIPNLEAVLTVTLPDNSQVVYNFQPTNDLGQTSLSVPPIQAANGTLIPYQVCLKSTESPSLCFLDSYVIWGNP
jgi:hypothetical protein